MPNLAAQVMADRLARDVAKSRFDGRFEALKADIAERGVTGRIADEAMEQAKLVFDEAVTIVEEHPAIVGGTMAAVVLWFVRNPIIGLAQSLRDQATR